MSKWWESTDGVLDIDAEIRRRGFDPLRLRSTPRGAGIVAWWGTLTTLGKIVVGLLATAALYYASRLLQRPAYIAEVSESRTYSFTPRRNTEGIGLPIPIVYGEHRVFGHKIQSYIDTANDLDTLYELFAMSEGPIAGIFQPETNEQPLENYVGAKHEVRLGTPDQLPIPWFADARNTSPVGIDMPDDGDVFVYRTFTKVDKFIVRARFLGGIQQVVAGADASSTVTVRVEHRRLGSFVWTSLGDTAIARNTRKPVAVQIASDALAGTAKRSPTVAVNNSNRGGTLPWTNPSFAAVSDDARATATDLSGTDRQTQWLEATGFGFDQIVPATATITGVLAEVELSSSPPTGDPGNGHENGATVREAEVYLLVGGVPVGINRFNTTDTIPFQDTVWARGGNGDLWSPAGLTAAQVRASNFGIAHSVTINNDTAQIDAIWLTVFWTDIATLAPTIREIRVTRVSQTGTPKVPMSFDSVDEVQYGAGNYPDVALLGISLQAGEQLQGNPTTSAFVKGRTVRQIASGLSGALAFDGIADLIAIPHIAGYALNVFTLEALVWLEDTAASGMIVAKSDNYFVWWDASVQQLRFEFRNAADTAWRGNPQDGGSAYVLPTKTWVRVSATFGGSGTRMRLYADGVLVSETAVINENPKQDVGMLAIGRWGPFYVRFWKGRIDDARIWNVERTALQIPTTLAEMGDGPITGLVSAWKFNDATGTTALDSTGTNSGLIVGADWSSRPLPATFGASVWSANAAECLADMLTHKRYGLGQYVADEDLILESFQDARGYFNEPVDGEARHRLDLVADESRPFSEWIDIVLNTCRGVLVEADGRFKLAVDREAATSQIFTTANIKPGSVKHTWASLTERFDQVEVFYLDRDNRFVRDAVRSPVLLAVSDPSFEAGGQGWFPEANWTFVSEQANARVGSRSARRDGSVVNPNAALRANGSVGFPVAPGESYRVEGWIKPSGLVNGSAAVRLSWRNAAQVEIAITGGNYITSGSTYQRSAVEAVAPPAAFFACPEFETLNHTSGTYYVDDLSLSVTGRSVKVKAIDGRGTTRRSEAQRNALHHLGVLTKLGRFVEWDCSLEALGVDVFDVVDLALDVPKWGAGGRIVGSDPSGANEVVTVDTDKLPLGPLTGYQFKVRHATDLIETLDVVSVAAPYTSAEGYPRQDVVLSGCFETTPKSIDALWLFGPRGNFGTRSFRIASATLTEELDRHLSGYEYDPTLYEPASDPSVEMHAQSYLGTGAARTIFLPFTPDLVIIRRRDVSARMCWRASNWGTAADEFMFVEDSAGWKTSSAYILALIENGVNIGTDAEVNASGGTYDLVAFRAGTRFAVGGYTGDGVAAGKIVGLTFAPQMVWVAGKGGTTRDTIYRNSNLPATESWAIKNSNTAPAAKGIESTGGNSFRVRGTGAAAEDLNASGQAYVWVAWGVATYNARLASFAGNGVDGRRISAVIPYADWAWLQTVESAAPDQGGFMRISGYDGTDTAMQVVSAAAKADVMERVWPDSPTPGSLEMQMGTKGNKVHASKSNHLYVMRRI